MNRSQMLLTRSRSPLTRARTTLTRSDKRRRPSKKLLLAGGIVAAVAAAAGGIATMPTTRRRLRQISRRRQETFVHVDGMDELTGLPTRGEAVRMLESALERARARGRRVAVLYIDLDDFQTCNDAFGAPAGDHVLQVSAARMQAEVRSGDTVCRIGGDDFLVIMEGAGPDHMLSRVGERIVTSLGQPITYDGETILTTASVGVAIAVNGDAEAAELMSQAERAIDRARASGRHVVQY